MIAYIEHGTLSANHLKARQVQSLVEDSELRPRGILGQIFGKTQVVWMSLQLRQTVHRLYHDQLLSDHLGYCRH